MNRIYAYLRASTKEQDANSSRKALEIFAKDLGSFPFFVGIEVNEYKCYNDGN